DKYIPESGVIVQKVLSSYWPQVEVVDTEGDNNINDTGSALVAGETYLFPGGQKILKVISDYGTGYDIQIKDTFSVEITSPNNTARLTPGSNYQVVAEAEEFGGTISKVEFYSD
ncbi:MAG: Ig-like domain-containing protein, partial [Dolichospermum sp.]